MRLWFLSTFLFVCLVSYGFGLECYTGFAVIRGRSVGTTTEVCKKDSDQCYKMSADVNMAIKGKMAGCSTYRCMLSKNTCLAQGAPGHRYELCCCNTDHCNANRERSTTDKLRGVLDAVSAGQH